jgi:hypothetical protein
MRLRGAITSPQAPVEASDQARFRDCSSGRSSALGHVHDLAGLRLADEPISGGKGEFPDRQRRDSRRTLDDEQPGMWAAQAVLAPGRAVLVPTIAFR